MKKSILVTALILSGILFLFIAHKINLAASDIGRHIKNGEVLLHAQTYNISRSALLYTNFFSYTHPDFPFINHHWGYGIIAYFTYTLFGWSGLTFTHTLTLIGAFLILFFLISKKTPLYASIPLSLFLIPLIAERTEVRPEGLSYLFIAVFLYILVQFADNKLAKKYLYVLPVLTILWVNIHIYAIFSPLLIGAFLFESVLRKDWEKIKTFSIFTFVSTLALLISPYGLEGALYPFKIFSNYGYLVAENQSIPFLENIQFTNPNFLWWKLSAFIALSLGLVGTLHTKKKFPLALGCITLAFGGLSFFGIRHLSLFGLVLLPFLASITGSLLEKNTSDEGKNNAWAISTIISLIIAISIFAQFHTRLPGNYRWGLGLLPRNASSVDFVRQTNIQGPFFSNYDIGGMLIFSLYTPERKEHVFVDNRPETYPKEFFSDTYIPMQENPSLWKAKSEEYNINAVWFYRLDATPWAQTFLISLVSNEDWVPVYVDDFTIIFLRENEQNKDTVTQYRLPKSMFTVQ